MHKPYKCLLLDRFFQKQETRFLQKEKLNEAFGDRCKNTPMSMTLYFSKPEYEKSWNIPSKLEHIMGFNKKRRSNWTLHPHKKKLVIQSDLFGMVKWTF